MRLERAWQARRAKTVSQADAEPTIPGQQPSYAVAPADGRKPTKTEKTKKPSLTGALISAYGGPFFTAALFKVSGSGERPCVRLVSDLWRPLRSLAKTRLRSFNRGS